MAAYLNTSDVMTQLLFAKRNYKVDYILAGNDAYKSPLQIARVCNTFDDQ